MEAVSQLTITPQLVTPSKFPLKIKFEPRPYQQELLDAIFKHDKHKIFLCWCRGSGKDVVCLNALFYLALREPGQYFYMLPTAVQARAVIFDTVLSSGYSMLDFIPSYFVEEINSSRMLIRLKNGSQIMCLGSEETSKRLVGTNPKGCVWSEWQVSREDSYTYLRSRLLLNKGYAIFNGTPRGQDNAFYTMFNAAKTDSDWFCSFKTVHDTKHIPEEDLAKEKASMSIDHYNQEMLCSFTCGEVGTYFGIQMKAVRLENRVSNNLFYDHSLPVYVSIDIGVRDPTAVVYYQVKGNGVYFLECEEFTNQGVDYLKRQMEAKEYIYHIPVFAPHDVKDRQWGVSGCLSRIETARQLGLELHAVEGLSLADEIEAVRLLLARCYFHETKCKRLVSALENYRRVFIEATQTYREEPRHDWTSHLVAAVRCATLAMPMCNAGTSQEEITRMYQEAKFGRSSNIPPVFRDNPGNMGRMY